MRAQIEGLGRKRLQVSHISQGLVGRERLELEGEAGGTHKAVERPGALDACETPTPAERLKRHIRDPTRAISPHSSATS